jgi:hypothetical protein
MIRLWLRDPSNQLAAFVTTVFVVSAMTVLSAQAYAARAKADPSIGTTASWDVARKARAVGAAE